MEERLILCSACGTKNRLGQGAGKPVCGSCSKILAVSRHKGGLLAILFLKKFWLLIAVGLVIFGWPYLEDMSAAKPRDLFAERGITPPPREPDASSYAPHKPPFQQPQIPVGHGVLSKTYSSGVAPLGIQTRAGTNYFIKLVNTATDQAILTAYLVGGRLFEVDVPLGTYEIRYAAGDIWYGPQYLFGPETVYSKADELFHFTFDGYQYSGYTVELILQAYGNLETSQIRAEDF